MKYCLLKTNIEQTKKQKRLNRFRVPQYSLVCLCSSYGILIIELNFYNMYTNVHINAKIYINIHIYVNVYIDLLRSIFIQMYDFFFYVGTEKPSITANT